MELRDLAVVFAELVQGRQPQEAGRLSDARLQARQAQGRSLQERIHLAGPAPLRASSCFLCARYAAGCQHVSCPS